MTTVFHLYTYIRNIRKKLEDIVVLIFYLSLNLILTTTSLQRIFADFEIPYWKDSTNPGGGIIVYRRMFVELEGLFNNAIYHLGAFYSPKTHTSTLCN